MFSHAWILVMSAESSNERSELPPFTAIISMLCHKKALKGTKDSFEILISLNLNIFYQLFR